VVHSKIANWAENAPLLLRQTKDLPKIIPMSEQAIAFPWQASFPKFPLHLNK
jgi:hypothetical protein